MTRRVFSVRSALVLVLLGVVGALSLRSTALWRSLAAWRVDEAAAVRYFRREPLSFLVTERIVTQVVVEKHAGNLVLGHKDGFLFGTVELLYGVDLTALESDAVRRDSGGIRVKVPAPRLLRAVPDLDSVRFVQKRSPLMAFSDKMSGTNFYAECVQELDDAAVRFVDERRLAPTRDELVGRLNEYAPVIASKIGAPVVFE